MGIRSMREAFNVMKKKVVLFIDIFGCGGIEKFLYNTCKFINRSEFDISVVSVILDKNSYYIKMFDEINVSIDQLVEHIETNPLKRMLKGHKAFSKYLEKLDKKTIIHFNISNSIDMKYAKIAYNAGFSNLIYHSHNSDATSHLKRIAHYFFRPFRYNYSQKYIACSKEAAIWMYPSEVINNRKYTIINNAIDVNLYDYNDKSRQKSRNDLNIKKEILIGHVGRYNIQKNHDFLIDIFFEIHKVLHNSKLLLIGEGELFDQIFSKIKSLSLEKDVIIIKQTNKVNEYMQAMDVFILPSLYEGLPFVLVEEQAAALPAVVSDTITREIEITNYIKYFSLDCSAKKWAEEAIDLLKLERKSTLEKISAAGFNASENIKKLECIYRSFE